MAIHNFSYLDRRRPLPGLYSSRPLLRRTDKFSNRYEILEVQVLRLSRVYPASQQGIIGKAEYTIHSSSRLITLDSLSLKDLVLSLSPGVSLSLEVRGLATLVLNERG